MQVIVDLGLDRVSGSVIGTEHSSNNGAQGARLLRPLYATGSALHRMLGLGGGSGTRWVTDAVKMPV